MSSCGPHENDGQTASSRSEGTGRHSLGKTGPTGWTQDGGRGRAKECRGRLGARGRGPEPAGGAAPRGAQGTSGWGGPGPGAPPSPAPLDGRPHLSYVPGAVLGAGRPREEVATSPSRGGDLLGDMWWEGVPRSALSGGKGSAPGKRLLEGTGRGRESKAGSRGGGMQRPEGAGVGSGTCRALIPEQT